MTNVLRVSTIAAQFADGVYRPTETTSNLKKTVKKSEETFLKRKKSVVIFVSCYAGPYVPMSHAHHCERCTDIYFGCRELTRFVLF